jgi:CheY-like chemotaxis protein
VESTIKSDVPTIGSASGKVLIVDDNVDSSQMLALLLEAHGLEVSMVFRGKDAAHAVREHAPEVILLDIGLPDIPGDELAIELRASGETDAILVAVTGYSDDEAKRRIQAAGFDEHLVKPVTAQQILEVLGRLRTKRVAR